jgi:hypothetical protein
MNVHWLIVAAMCGATGWVRAADEVETPGTQPQWAVVREMDAEAKTVSVMVTVTKPVFETYQYTVEVAGRQETRVAQRKIDVSEVRVRLLKLAETRVVTAGKAKLDEAAALKRLTPDTPVLLHPGSQKLDPRYLALLKDDALILVVPAEAPAPMPPGGVGPAPVLVPPAPK